MDSQALHLVPLSIGSFHAFGVGTQEHKQVWLCYWRQGICNGSKIADNVLMVILGVLFYCAGHVLIQQLFRRARARRNAAKALESGNLAIR